MNKIYIFQCGGWGNGDVSMLAVADDGDEITKDVADEFIKKIKLGLKGTA